MNNITSADNGGRRNGVERRQFSYALHIPERRSWLDRRKSNDRRKARYTIIDETKPERGISL